LDASDSADADDDFGGDASDSGAEPAPEPAGSLVHETQPDSPSTPPPAPQPAGGPRQPRGFVVLTIGLPGSGKTTWFKRRSVTPLSSDMLRGILFDDITEQRYQGLVFSTLRSLLRARLIAKMPWNYVDATNLSPHERRQWIKMATSFGYDVQAVFFDVPFEVCMERNHRRERVVSDEVMKQMNDRLRPPTFKEGFSKITVVRVKGVPGSMPVGGGQADDLAGPADAGDEPAGSGYKAESDYEPGDDGPDQSSF
jgi:predicted kinase